MKTVKIILGIIIALSAISTLAGGLAYATGPHDKNPEPMGPFASNLDTENANIQVTKISAIVLGIGILLYFLTSKFSK